MCSSNPREFSKLLKGLDPRKCTEIPLKVYNEEGQLKDNIERVLDNWHQDFKTLLNRPGDVGFDDNFYNECIQEKYDLEQNNLVITPELNVPITLEEIQKFVSKLKKQKATGIARIPNEVLKQEDIMVIFYKLFCKYFLSPILPTVWLKAIITQIAKSSSKDSHVPLNYKGISLLSCVGKVFSGIINVRVVNYCKENGIYEDEQNGFRKHRSYLVFAIEHE